MKTRLITAAIAVAVFLPFLFYSGTFATVVLACVLSVLAEYEMLNCIGILKKATVSVPAFIVAFLLPFGVRFFENGEKFVEYAFFLLFAFVFYVMLSAIAKTITLEESAIAGIWTIYISFAFSSLVLLRDLNHGEYLYVLVFLIPWISDAFAYFIGVKFGRHKLAPEISPKKSVEGSVAGIVFGTLAPICYGFGVEQLYGAEPSYLALFILGLIISVVSQCGDLAASLVKRRFGIKDYGTIFPGHGGIIDRFDSVLPTAPFMYILCSGFSFFTLFN